MNETRRALVVDTDPEIGRVVGDALGERWSVVAPHDDADLLDRAGRGPFDVVFLHHGYDPSVSRELVQTARRLAPGVGVVLLASQPGLDGAPARLELGADEVLVKPLGLKDIREAAGRFPRAERELAAPTSPRLLVVDDDVHVLGSVEDTLDDEGYSVTATRSPREALELVRERPFEVLVTDLMMDELPGMDLIRAARALRPTLAVVVMTGYGSKQAVLAALNEGADEFLEKPLTPALIRRAVDRCWRAVRLELENRKLLAEVRAKVRALETSNARLRDAQTQLVRASHLVEGHRQSQEQLLEILATASHDLKTPLSATQGALKLLQTGAHFPSLPDECKRLIDLALRAAGQMDELLGELRRGRVGRGEAFSIERVALDVGTLVLGTVEAMQTLASEAGVTLEGTAEAALLAEADARRITQVLWNLIGNACKHSPRGGVVAVTAEAAGADRVRVSVADQGPGIPAQQQTGLFGAFVQASPDARGVGLGLHICKSIVEGHGGRLWLESELGVGTTFRFELDRAAPAS